MFIQKRLKAKKRKKTKQKNTVDKTHSIFVERCNKLEEEIKEKEYRIQQLQKEADMYENIKLTHEEWRERERINEEIETLTSKLKEDREFENNYYMDTGHLLFDYYDLKKDKSIPLLTGKVPKNSVVSFFTKTTEKLEEEHKEKVNDSIHSIITKYRNKTNDFSPQLLSVSGTHVEICSECNCNKILVNNDSMLLCPKCGEEQEVLLSQEKPSYKEPPKEYTHFAYKRINHFNEWLSQFQAKESTFISKEIIDKLKNEIKKERIKKENISNIPVNKIRSYLKKLGLNKYYEHIPHIMTRLTGIPPPIIPREKEEMLRTMFKQIQTPFFNNCPSNRKNFLSYSYVLHKFTQLLNMDELSACFPLLKSRTKLYQQDLIWKDICKELHWQFIKSI